MENSESETNVFNRFAFYKEVPVDMLPKHHKSVTVQMAETYFDLHHHFDTEQRDEVTKLPIMKRHKNADNIKHAKHIFENAVKTIRDIAEEEAVKEILKRCILEGLQINGQSPRSLRDVWSILRSHEMVARFRESPENYFSVTYKIIRQLSNKLHCYWLQQAMARVMTKFFVTLEKRRSQQHSFVSIGMLAMAEIIRMVKRVEMDAVGCAFYVKPRGVTEESHEWRRIKLDSTLLPEQNNHGHWLRIRQKNRYHVDSTMMETIGQLNVPTLPPIICEGEDTVENCAVRLCKAAWIENVTLVDVIKKIEHEYEKGQYYYLFFVFIFFMCTKLKRE